MLKRKGQSTLEYVIILTAIIAAIVFAAATMLKPRIESGMNHVSQEMESGMNVIHFGANTAP